MERPAWLWDPDASPFGLGPSAKFILSIPLKKSGELQLDLTLITFFLDDCGSVSTARKGSVNYIPPLHHVHIKNRSVAEYPDKQPLSLKCEEYKTQPLTAKLLFSCSCPNQPNKIIIIITQHELSFEETLAYFDYMFAW